MDRSLDTAAHVPTGRETPVAVSTGPLTRSRRATLSWLLACGLGALLLWSHWPTLADLWEFWQRNQDYSSGELVPLIAAYVVWSRRKTLRTLPIQACWWGLAVLLASQAVRFVGIYYMYGSIERYSVLLAAVGAVLLVAGYPITRRLLWVWAFLLLMMPLPGRVHNTLALPLQGFATTSAVFGLELLGYLVARDGNVLRLSDQGTIAVAEACSGLRMLTAFVVVGGALAFVVRRPKWQKWVLVLSTIPVAILANTLRLIATAVVYDMLGSEAGERFFHDFAGITMMPFAFAILIGVLWLMRRLAPQAPAAPQPRTA